MRSAARFTLLRLIVLNAIRAISTVAAAATPLLSNTPLKNGLGNDGAGILGEMFVKKHPRELPEPWSPEFWWRLVVSAGLVLAGGVFAGLTLGLMGLDELHLRVLSSSSDDLNEKKNAKKVLQLLERGRHWILVVLLLCNVVINESLPIFLDSAIGGGIAAVVISTTAIVIFGEIIPQAVCVRYGLGIGAACAPFVLVLMYLLAPIAWPIAKLLDYVLGGKESTTYKKAELRSFLQFHRHGEDPLRDDEIAILNGVLELNTKSVESIMTPLKDTVVLGSDTILDHATVDKIILSGYSRFPVHESNDPSSFMGLLLVKKLIQYDPSQALPVSSFPLSILPEAPPTINCFQALDYFQTGRAHLLLISKTPGKSGGAIGVVTLEDIIEEIISEEIVDETDRWEDNHHKRKARRMTTAAIMRGIVERHIRRNSTSTIRTDIPGENAPLLAGQGLPSLIYGSASTYSSSRHTDYGSTANGSGKRIDSSNTVRGVSAARSGTSSRSQSRVRGGGDDDDEVFNQDGKGLSESPRGDSGTGANGGAWAPGESPKVSFAEVVAKGT